MFWSLVFTCFVIIGFSGWILKLYQLVVSKRASNFRDDAGNAMKGSAPTIIVGDALRQLYFPSSLEEKPFLEQGDVYFRWFFWKPVVYIVEQAAIRRVLVDNMNNYTRDTPMSHNLIAADSFGYKRQRRIIEQVFDPENLDNLLELLAKTSKSLLDDLLLDSQGNGKLFSVHKTFNKYTRELMGRIMYGNSADAKKVILAHKFFADNTKSLLRVAAPWLARIAPGRFGIPSMQEGTDALQRLVKNPESGTLLDLLVQAAGKDADGMPIKEIKSNIIAMGYAGMPAVASALTSLVYTLSKNPESQEKIHDEIQKGIGRDPITYNSLRDMPYLTMVLKETLRLYPPYPVLFTRTAKKADKLGGFQIPPKTSVVIDVAGHNRHPQHYNNPDQFIPERFSKEDGDIAKATKELDLTWGAGPRSSVGKRFAKLIVRTTVVNMLRNYRIATSNAKVAGVEMTRSFGTLKPQPELFAQLGPA